MHAEWIGKLYSLQSLTAEVEFRFRIAIKNNILTTKVFKPKQTGMWNKSNKNRRMNTLPSTVVYTNTKYLNNVSKQLLDNNEHSS